MNRIDHFSSVGIESISWNRLQGPDSNLPEKSLKPLGNTRLSYIRRVFKTQNTDMRIAESLAYQVTDERILTPSNYQDILEQLRRISANPEAGEGKQHEIFTRTFQLLDELSGNIHQLNLNRQLQSNS